MTFDLDAAYALGERVTIRPEPFGALVYDGRSRRLVVVQDLRLRAVLDAVGTAPSVRAACEAAGVAALELPAFTAALAALERSGTLRRQDVQAGQAKKSSQACSS